MSGVRLKNMFLSESNDVNNNVMTAIMEGESNIFN